MPLPCCVFDHSANCFETPQPLETCAGYTTKVLHLPCFKSTISREIVFFYLFDFLHLNLLPQSPSPCWPPCRYPVRRETQWTCAHELDQNPHGSLSAQKQSRFLIFSLQMERTLCNHMYQRICLLVSSKESFVFCGDNKQGKMSNFCMVVAERKNESLRSVAMLYLTQICLRLDYSRCEWNMEALLNSSSLRRPVWTTCHSHVCSHVSTSKHWCCWTHPAPFREAIGFSVQSKQCF